MRKALGSNPNVSMFAETRVVHTKFCKSALNVIGASGFPATLFDIIQNECAACVCLRVCAFMRLSVRRFASCFVCALTHAQR